MPGSIAALAAVHTGAAAVPGAAIDHLSFDLGKSTVSEAIGARAVVTSTIANPSTAISDGTRPHAPGAADAVTSPDGKSPASGCEGWTSVKFYPKRKETFLNLYNNDTAEVDEEIGSSHTLGIGSEVTGGAWGADGSASLETHTSAGDEVTYKGNQQIQNYVNSWEYRRHCFKQGGAVWYYNYEIRSSSFNALQVSSQHIINRSWNTDYCVTYYSGTHHKDASSNQTFSAGFNAPYINLSAQASFSKDTTITWRPASKGEQICASTSDGWVTAPFAGAQAIPTTGCRVAHANTEGIRRNFWTRISRDC